MAENTFLSFSKEHPMTREHFMKVWASYDKDGNGNIEGTELHNFMKDLLKPKMEKGETITDDQVAEYTALVMAECDTNKDNKLQLIEMLELLPVEENFLASYRQGGNLTSVQFMEIWRNYDKNGDGFIKGDEFKAFLMDLSQTRGRDLTAEDLDKYTAVMLDVFDANKDGKLQLNEMVGLLPTECNFIKTLRPRPRGHGPSVVTQVLQKYDEDNTGKLEGVELDALVKDLFEATDDSGTGLTEEELEKFKKGLLEICGDKDGAISWRELSMILKKTL